MAEKQQFDEFLGGSQSLPHEVSIMKLVASRASEISAMTHSIENPEQTKMIFQKLPIYMRRRVMSHNVKRLPRRLREAHLKQMAKSGSRPVAKRPSRKYRRRPRNLLSAYNRRQRNKIWLETHIWHAKRFCMIDKWGYRIASHPNDRCFKANYRAIAKHCLIQDISYYTCIEVTGEQSLLTETLKTHCNPSALSFAARIYIDGNREGTLMFFRKNGYPNHPIGNIHFFWRPRQSDIRTIWIWVHPACYHDVVSEIISNFEFKQDNIEKNKSSAASVESLFYKSVTGCTMTILRNALNRFRFYGPLTLNILTEALQLPVSLNEIDSPLKMDYLITKEPNNSLDNQKLETDKKSVDSHNMQPSENIEVDEMSKENIVLQTVNFQELNRKSWHIEYYKHCRNMEVFKIQEEFWKILKILESPNQLPPNVIMGLTVLDPRFYLPKKRTKCKKDTVSSQLIQTPPIDLNHTPIWDAQIRHTVSESCVPSSTINKLRSECLVPGVLNDQNFDQGVMAKIPILLIQKPGNNVTGLCSGIDVIIPVGWAMPFWLAFLLRCARVGGLRESRSIVFESLNINSPDFNEPDSPAYIKEALDTKEELTNKYFRYSPNKRVNFVKLGIRNPFSCDWKTLMEDWTGTDEFYVLRNRELLLLLQKNIRQQTSDKRKNTKPSHSVQTDFQDFLPYKNCLIRVKASLVRKGCPKRFAIICMPTLQDLQEFKKNKNWVGPVEKLHIDSNEKLRKKSRKDHLMLLKRLKRQRIRRKKTFTGEMELLKKYNFIKISTEQAEKMRKLYLPECTEIRVRYSCDREVMGYLTVSDFSFNEAKGLGIGYVTLNALIEMINQKSNIILVRNTQTRQYRTAVLDILGV